MKTGRRILAVCCFGGFLAANVLCFGGDWSLLQKAILTGSSVMLFCLGMILYYGTIEAIKRRRNFLWGMGIALFAYYLLLLVGMLYLSIFIPRLESPGINLTPFRFIRIYYRAFQQSGAGYALMNLAGNLVLFMPMGFYLPLLFKHMRKVYWFLPAIIIIISAAEWLQFVTNTGTCDIDNVILNTAGAFIAYLITVLGIGLHRRRMRKREGQA